LTKALRDNPDELGRYHAAMPAATGASALPPHLVPGVRQADAGLLSLALMDARNQTLALLAHWEEGLAAGLQVPAQPGLELPQWIAGHVAWFADWWIARNTRRGQGPACEPDAPRLPPTEAGADRWWNPLLAPHAQRWDLPLPGIGELRPLLLEQLERTLELLEHARPDDEGLYFWRAALWHEDQRGEQLVQLAQAVGLPLPLLPSPGYAERQPLALPATRWSLGDIGAGFACDVEQGAHAQAVPEFEIDAQPVSWGQYVEFVLDGGYDRPELWQPEGWGWLQALAAAEGRRGPRHVEQIGGATGAVLQQLYGKPVRRAAQQPVLHASWWEADAYARWAGRRLPTEVEWEVAAHQAGSRGFRWGEVWEWTAGTLRPWPGFAPAPWARHGDWDAGAAFGRARVLRGASFATRSRWVWPRRRAWALPGRDDLFVGFRTCAV
jgi:ergothioneine biosynthesis protein EgtB